MAMRLGKHCFCQKPLAHTIYEARLMGQVAREMKVATQMGNQGTAETRPAATGGAAAGGRGGSGARDSRVDQSSHLAARDHPSRAEPVSRVSQVGPLAGRGAAAAICRGTAQQSDGQETRKELRAYHPFKWRGWWDFGTGALGDMGCHIVNMPFMGLDLRNPISVEAETSGTNKDSFPAWSIVTFQFAATKTRPAVKLVWYDGGKMPSVELCGGEKPVAGGGCLVVGDKGKMFNG